MSNQCEECGKELNFRDVRVFHGHKYCDACLSKIDPRSAQSIPTPSIPASLVPGASISMALKVFGNLSMLAGLITCIALAEEGSTAVLASGALIAGLFWGVMLLGFSKIIDLLRIIASGVKK